MKKKLLEIFEVCLQVLEQGETIDNCIRPYPDLADELRPLLESAQCLGNHTGDELSALIIQRNRERVLSQASKMRSVTKPPRYFVPFVQKALIVLSIVAIMIFATRDLLVVSASSLPGQPLYLLKRSVEVTQLKFTSDPTQRKQLENEFRLRRVDETEKLLLSGTVALVDFDGMVRQKLSSGWMVDNIPVVVTTDTQIKSEITLGIYVEVVGMTHTDGRVFADRIDVESQEIKLQNDTSDDNSGSNRVKETEIPVIEPEPTRVSVDNSDEENEYEQKEYNANTKNENSRDSHESDELDRDRSDQD